jgi:xanthine/uracil permease
VMLHDPLCACDRRVFLGSISLGVRSSADMDDSRMKNGSLASINNFRSFSLRFDPKVRSISFFVFAFPLANRSGAVQANSNVASDSFNCCSARVSESLSTSSKDAFSFSNTPRLWPYS